MQGLILALELEASRGKHLREASFQDLLCKQLYRDLGHPQNRLAVNQP